jgi:hypothetical protein
MVHLVAINHHTVARSQNTMIDQTVIFSYEAILLFQICFEKLKVFLKLSKGKVFPIFN